MFVSIISTKIPFKGAGKEYIGDDIEEMVGAVKQAIQACGVQLRVSVCVWWPGGGGGKGGQLNGGRGVTVRQSSKYHLLYVTLARTQVRQACRDPNVFWGGVARSTLVTTSGRGWGQSHGPCMHAGCMSHCQ